MFFIIYCVLFFYSGAEMTVLKGVTLIILTKVFKFSKWTLALKARVLKDQIPERKRTS